MQSENKIKELKEYRAELRRIQDNVAETYAKIAIDSRTDTGAWLSELLSISILDADRQLATRSGHTGDLALLKHGIRLATALLDTLKANDEPDAEKMSRTMVKTINALGTNLQTSAFVIEHALNPASAISVN